MSQSIFDIVGPVMVGPSSSHTAGAVRLGHLARQIAGKSIKSVECVLYNSFAQTCKGHGTDLGLVAGLLGYAVDDPRIRTAFSHAEEKDLVYTITPFSKSNNLPPNTVVFKMVLMDDEVLTVVGHSVGGGRVYVSRLNEYSVSLKGDAPTIIMFYDDKPGMIWKVTKIIAEQGVNIASLECSRRRRGLDAFMSITLDEPIGEEELSAIRLIEDVHMVRSMDRV